MIGRHGMALWLAFLAAIPGGSEAMEIEPRIDVAEIYTTNVNLQPKGAEEDDWVTSVTPGVKLGIKSADVQLDLDYTLQALFYLNDTDLNEVYNLLNGTTLVNVVGERLQLRADGVIEQVNVNPSKQISNSNINVTGNLVNSVAWDAGPIWSQPVFSNSQFDGELLAGRINYGDISADKDISTGPVDIQDVDTLDGRVSLHTLSDSVSPLTYDLAYEYERLDYQDSGDATTQSAYLQLGYQVSPEFRAFVLGGLDSDFEQINDSSLDKGRWEVGFGTFSPSNVFEAAVGHRYFGTTMRVKWLREHDDTTFSLSYDETPTTSDLTDVREIPVYPAPENPPVIPPDAYLDQPGSPSRYIDKRADAAARWRLYRSAVSLDLFWERQDDQVAIGPEVPAPTSVQDERAYGMAFDFAWFVGSKSEAGVNVSWVSREYLNSTEPTVPPDEDVLIATALRFIHQLGIRTRIGFETGYRDDDVSEGSGSDYDEYWAKAELVRTF